MKYLRWSAVLVLLLVLCSSSAWARPTNGRWSGIFSWDDNYSTIAMRIRGTQMSRIQLGGIPMTCWSRDDNSQSDQAVTLSLNETQNFPFFVPADGVIDGGFEITEGVQQGLTVAMVGKLRRLKGWITVVVSVDSELEWCQGSVRIPVAKR